MAKISLLTMAYNAEKTLRRAVDSVLSQDMEDFVYYLVDNGSTDKTRGIIEEYANKDSRVVPCYFDENYLYRSYDFFKKISVEKIGEYFAVLDSDDEYTPGAFRELIEFTSKNRLDFACGGNSFIDALTGKPLGNRGVAKELVVDEKSFGSVPLSVYHAIVRPVWCKLFKLDVMCEIEMEPFYSIRYGADTAFCLSMIKVCKRFGFLPGTHYNYYVNPKSDSYTWDESRILADRKMDDFAREFLISKIAKIDPQNDIFLKIVYLNAVVDTLNIILKAQILAIEKMRYIKDIMINEKTRALFSDSCLKQHGLEERMRAPVVKWLITQKECRKDTHATTAAEIIMAMHGDLQQMVSKDGLTYIIAKIPDMVKYLVEKDYNKILERLSAWFKRHDADIPALTELEILSCSELNKPDKEIFKLLTNIKKNRLESSNSLDIDSRILKITKRYPLLEKLGVNLVFAFSNAISHALDGNFQQAVDAFIAMQEVEISDEDEEAYIIFAQNLSAAAENADVFVYFKKLHAQFLLEHGRTDEAVTLVKELAKLLPADNDVIELESKLGLPDNGDSKKIKEVSADMSNNQNVKTKPTYRTGVDDEFDALIKRIETESIEQMLTVAAKGASEWLNTDHEYYGLLLKWYKNWYNIGAFAQDQGFINYFGSLYMYLKKSTTALSQLYESFADYRSKMILKEILNHWLTFHPDLRKRGVESTFEHYFDLDVIQCDENEVFVDCGCFIGDTVQEFIKQYGGRYKSIYSYELTPSTYKTAKENLRGIPRLHLRNVGVSDKNGQFPMIDNIGGGGGNRLHSKGNIMAKVVRIDDDIAEDVTFIKMDVEGAEIGALNGAEQQIRKNKPKLAISLYHNHTDLIEIPKLVKSFVPQYQLYLRHHPDTMPFPTEYVLLAVNGQFKDWKG